MVTKNTPWASAPSVSAPSASASESEAQQHDGELEENGGNSQDWEQEAKDDAEFFQWLDNSQQYGTYGPEGEAEVGDGVDAENGELAEANIRGFEPYLGFSNEQEVEAEADDVLGPKVQEPGSDADKGDSMDWGDNAKPGADALNNTYVRVVHSNGIHHLAMVSCHCQGADSIPLDLVACRLLPASFKRIRTLFTTSLMDYFRLCNLELKASAYQFYQLIRRMTQVIGHAEIVNLYHEFRRMSRLWRWMKKLKWAGYGHNKQDPLHPPAGSLANFCPTCPQPGINLPEDWKSDRNRYEIFIM